MPWIEQISVDQAKGFLKKQFDDAQVIAYFNYITCISDSLGVEPEDFIEPWGVD